MSKCEYYFEEQSICTHPAMSSTKPRKINDSVCSKCTLPRSFNSYSNQKVQIEDILATDNRYILTNLLQIHDQIHISFNFFTQKLEITFSNENVSPLSKKKSQIFSPPSDPPFRISPTGHVIEEIYSDPNYTIEFSEIDFSKFDQIVPDPLLNEQINLEMIFDGYEHSNEHPNDINISDSIQSISDIDRILSQMRSSMISALNKRRKQT